MRRKRQALSSSGPPAAEREIASRAVRRKSRRLPLGVRAGLLAVLWVLVNGWTLLHFGRELTELGLLNAVLAAYAAILGLLPEGDREQAAGDWKEILGRALRRLVDGRNLVVLYLLFVAIGSFVSSVHVEVGESPKGTVVRILEPDGEEVARKAVGEDDLVRFPLSTIYAGRPLMLAATGRTPRDLDAPLRPWWPHETAIADLATPPGVRLRVPLEDLAHLSDRGVWVFECADGGEPVVFPARRRDGVLLLGTAEADPGALDRWLTTVETEAWRAAARDAWEEPRPGPSLDCLTDGGRVRAVLCTPGGVMTAEATFVTGSGVRDVELGPPNGPDPCRDISPPPE